MYVKAYVLLKVNSGRERDVCKKIADLDKVIEACIIYGEFDLIAKVIVEDLGELDTFLSNNVRNIPSVMLTSTIIVAREYKGKVKRN